MRLVLLLLISFLCKNINAQDTLNFLKVGDAAPAFTTINHLGDSISLRKILDSNKVVLVFYRGAWCPYCNKHMSELQDGLKSINDKGAVVIAVTPETDSSMMKIIDKSHASFSVIHDENYLIMKSYGVAFKMDEITFKRYKLIGLDVEEANGNKDHILPVPATFIIGKDLKIEYVHFDTNYKVRASVAEILKHLKS